MRDCDIKFVNKPPFSGLSLFFKMLENAGLPNILNRVAFRSRVPTGATDLFSSYWDCLQVYGAARTVSGILTWCAMTQLFAICSAGNAEQTIGHTSVTSANFHKPSISGCSVNCSDGSSRSCCSTIIHWTLILL